MADAGAGEWLTRTDIAPGGPIAATADRVLPGLLDPDFAACTVTDPVCNWRMRDVVYLRDPGMAYRDGVVVAATDRPGMDADLDYVQRRLTQTRYRLGPGRRVFMATVRFSGNYYHQLVEIIPAVLAYADDPDFSAGLLLASAEGFVPLLPAALRLAGAAVPQMVPVPMTAPPLVIGDLTYCSLLNGSPHPSLFAGTVYDRLVAGAGAPDGPRLIYVWRADAVARPMRNEDELVERLTELGIEPVVLSGLGLAEQVRLFHGARLVIGPHGAGMANVVFCARGAVMYELLPSHYTNPCMGRLAQSRGVHYWCDVHRAEARPEVWRHETPWSVDIDAVVARVETILAAYRLG
jgi:capsular polysaccharide biosynthesis protein